MYESNSLQSSYILNTNPMSQPQAEEFCRCNGMHLATWESKAEQNEVRTTAAWPPAVWKLAGRPLLMPGCLGSRAR